MEEKEKEKALKEVMKGKKLGMSSDKKIILSLITIVIVIALGIFGVFYYNNNLVAVATFDGGKLTAAEFTIYYKVFAPMLEYYGYPAEIIPEQIANKAAMDKVLLLRAKEAGITLSDEDKEKVDEIFNDENEIKRFTDDGIDPKKMKQLYYNDHIITAYYDKVKDEIPDEEVIEHIKLTYGEEVDMREFVTRHILFTTVDEASGGNISEEAEQEVLAKANEVLAKALAGEDFSELAKEYSNDPGTKEEGGLYKLYIDNNTVPEYLQAVESLEAGSVTTELVKTTYGYHIIKLEEIVENGRVKSDNDRTEIARTKIDKLGEEVNLEINEEALNKVVERITGVKTQVKQEEKEEEFDLEEFMNNMQDEEGAIEEDKLEEDIDEVSTQEDEESEVEVEGIDEENQEEEQPEQQESQE